MINTKEQSIRTAAELAYAMFNAVNFDIMKSALDQSRSKEQWLIAAHYAWNEGYEFAKREQNESNQQIYKTARRH